MFFHAATFAGLALKRVPCGTTSSIVKTRPVTGSGRAWLARSSCRFVLVCGRGDPE
jgi:hypothetical protein